jgi:spore coat polysaccharide biosynthesis protein SpsF
MNKLFIIIQARMTSTRLPKKVMLPLCDTTVLDVMIKRLHTFHAHLVIATTDDGTEAPIVAYAKQEGIRCFRGSVENVLARYYHSAVAFGAKNGDTIVRLTSDCPLIDPNLIEEAVQEFWESESDYVYVDIRQAYPRGFDAEVFRFEALEEAYNYATSPFEQEHVTPYIKTKEGLKKAAVSATESHAHLRLTLDTPEDYALITAVYRHFDCDIHVPSQAVLHYLDQHPDVAEVNQTIQQKTP